MLLNADQTPIRTLLLSVSFELAKIRQIIEYFAKMLLVFHAHVYHQKCNLQGSKSKTIYSVYLCLAYA